VVQLKFAAFFQFFWCWYFHGFLSGYGAVSRPFGLLFVYLPDFSHSYCDLKNGDNTGAGLSLMFTCAHFTYSGLNVTPPFERVMCFSGFPSSVVFIFCFLSGFSWDHSLDLETISHISPHL